MEYNIPAEVKGSLKTDNYDSEHEYMDNMIVSVSRTIQATPQKTLPDPIDYLKTIMDKRGLRNKDLKIYIGSSGNVCSILKRRKPLSLRMIRNLNRYLHISAEILIQPYDCH